MQKSTTSTGTSRRAFLRNSSLLVAGGAIAASQVQIARGAHAFGSDTIKLGLVGCGGRGTGAVVQAMNTSGGEVKLVAVADTFADRVTGAIRGITGQHPNKVEVPKERQFVGLDAYKDLLQTDCDLVILATPPGFRPLHFAAAIAAGKHVFAEKPVAVDGAGVRKFLEANEEAKKKNLAVAVGLQRRHERKYMETVKAIQEGACGDIILARAYWNGRKPWSKDRQDGQTELEYQIRNWYNFNWVCGDHIVEQHIHNLDVINWIKNAYPVSAQGQGGCTIRRKDYGEIFDHHAVEFTYADGTVMLSQCRHTPDCWDSVSEHVHGTKGYADVSGSKIYGHDKQLLHNFSTLGANGHQQEHHDLFADIRAGRLPNEGEWGAKSTMTAILGRLATYSGKVVKWDDALNSEKVLAPVEAYTNFDAEAPVKPDADGWYALPVPGQYKAV
ncbi:MAG: Gfo/Idh/MocA family oxidoreductase [Pirellulaceae bacterium]|nr:Gfo/Idh/MocA family oxidoreductase [Pirellulaceae bacterium]